MATQTSVKILDLYQVAPAFDSPESATTFSVPLTLFDTYWIKFPPVERIFFYELAESDSTPAIFNSVILPKLKQSLAQTLLHFRLLAAKITWPLDTPKPYILCTPNDTVSLTVAESSADFDRLTGHGIRDAVDSHPYIPELPSYDTEAFIIALQVTFFPNKGFCIGIINHHAILDGKSATMFMKAWAYTCKSREKDPILLPELTPFHDRAVIKDVAGLETVYLNQWLHLSKAEPNPRSLKVWSTVGSRDHIVRATFELSCEDIKKLREKALHQLNKIPESEQPLKPVHLSTFVLTCAFVSIGMVKARGGDGTRKVCFCYSVDSRIRLDPPIPDNYFGNCVTTPYFLAEARIFMDENGLAMVAGKISDTIKALEKGIFEGTENRLSELFALIPEAQGFGVAGSTRFGVYGSDFGWGRPKMVEITSVDRSGAIAMAESRDGSGGVEIGLALKREELERFGSFFVEGLKDV